MEPKLKNISFLILSIGILSVACNPKEAVNQSPLPIATASGDIDVTVTESSSPAAVQPAAIVNGEVISINTYQANLDRYNAAIDQVGTILATDNVRDRILEELIFRQLLSQAARENGFFVDNEMVMQRLDELTQSIGGQTTLDGWMIDNFYTHDSLLADLSLEMEAAWMREQIVATTPTTAEQVLARQVLFFTSFQAERIYAQLQNGASFNIIVANNDPQQLGYLGWFPRGYLFDIEVENAAFQLQPGQYSPIIETQLGYHIIELLDYDANRPLSKDALLKFKGNTLRSWLEQKWSDSQIEILVQ